MQRVGRYDGFGRDLAGGYLSGGDERRCGGTHGGSEGSGRLRLSGGGDDVLAGFDVTEICLCGAVG